MIITRSRFCDDFETAEPDAAEFRAEGIVVDSNFLDLIFRRNTAVAETVDYKIAAIVARAPARSCNLLQIGGQLVFVVREGIDEVFVKDCCIQARVGIDADLITRFRHFNVGLELGKCHRDRQRAHPRGDSYHFGKDTEVGSGNFEPVFTGFDWDFEISRLCAGSFLCQLVALINLDLCARHYGARRVDNMAGQSRSLAECHCSHHEDDNYAECFRNAHVSSHDWSGGSDCVFRGRRGEIFRSVQSDPGSAPRVFEPACFLR